MLATQAIDFRVIGTYEREGYMNKLIYVTKVWSSGHAEAEYMTVSRFVTYVTNHTFFRGIESVKVHGMTARHNTVNDIVKAAWITSSTHVCIDVVVKWI